MDNEAIKKIFSLTNDEFTLMVDFQKKAEHAKILYCELHDVEWFDFKADCYACIQEKEELELAAKFLSEEIEKEKLL
jgi:hypothetical protein